LGNLQKGERGGGGDAIFVFARSNQQMLDQGFCES
jgi:hypothetical protein